MHAQAQSVAAQVQRAEIGTVFTLYPQGVLTQRADLHSPEAYWSEALSSNVDTMDLAHWQAETGLSGQHAYHGGVMHPSEFFGPGLADHMIHLAEDGSVTFALVTVDDLEAAIAGDDADIGWAIVVHSDSDED